MKLKLIAVAALAVCGAGAFAATKVAPATTTCDVATTAAVTNTPLLMVQNCVPDVTVYVAGASAQKPAIDVLMLASGIVFDNTKPIAYVAPSTNTHTTPALSFTSDEGKTVKSGIKNTVIYMGVGTSTGNPLYKGKLIAFVYNTANGSFAGVKQMTKGLPSSDLFKETTSFITRKTNLQSEAAMTCVNYADQLPAGTVKAASALAAGSTATTLVCNVDANHTFNYTTEKVVPGGLKGVQMALADVDPKHASPDVAAAVGAPLKAASFQVIPTAVQGFGVIVNNKALNALIANQQAKGQLPGCTTDVSASPLTSVGLGGVCQPNVSRALMTAIIKGTATGALVSGNASDTTPIKLQRRNNWSGTQAASNLMFGGYGATEGRAFADLATLTKFTTMNITGAVNTWDEAGFTTDSVGNKTKTSGAVTFVNNVASSDVIAGVANDTTNYAFGVVSLEKVQKTSSSGLAGTSPNAASWTKIDGISPNFTGSTLTDLGYDAYQRKGMANGYPFQYEMVAIRNTTLLAPTSGVAPYQAAIVDAVIKGIGNSTYNLPGIAYFTVDSADTADGAATRKAVFTRGGGAANFSPLMPNNQ